MITSVPRLEPSLPSEYPADSSLHSEYRTSPISISGQGLRRGRGAILLQPSPVARHSQAILGPVLGVIQDMYLDSTHKGRKLSEKSRRCLRRSLTGLRNVPFQPISPSIYRPNPRLERYSNPFSDSLSGRRSPKFAGQNTQSALTLFQLAYMAQGTFMERRDTSWQSKTRSGRPRSSSTRP
jgi:hypothetical protein